MNRLFRQILVTSAVTLIAGLGNAGATTFAAYISPPGAVATNISGATTETFNGVSLTNNTNGSGPFVSPIGTYTGNNARVPVIAADQYGGAFGSQYMYVGSRTGGDSTSVTINLNSPANYFGFWWSAGDPLNQVTVYQGSVEIAQFTTADLTTFLANNPVYALNGTSYNTADYYGNPTPAFSGQDRGEPFAYVNLVATGFQFDTIVMDNNGTSGFENDNNSIFAGGLNIPRDYSQLLFVEDVPYVNPPTPSPIPEPNYGILMGLMLAGGLIWKLRPARQTAV